MSKTILSDAQKVMFKTVPFIDKIDARRDNNAINREHNYLPDTPSLPPPKKKHAGVPHAMALPREGARSVAVAPKAQS